MSDKIANPFKYYKSPLALGEDSALDNNEKIKALENWRDEITRLNIAEAENMPAPKNEDNLQVVAAIEKMLNTLAENQ